MLHFLLLEIEWEWEWACVLATDDQGYFVIARTEWMSPICSVNEGEALGLLAAIDWVTDLQLENVDFVLDSKAVVDSFLSSKGRRLYFWSYFT